MDQAVEVRRTGPRPERIGSAAGRSAAARSTAGRSRGRHHAALALALLGLVPGCSGLFLYGLPTVDRSQPIARIETRGGVEYGATTREGILFLGRTATEGPCRVEYFVGGTPLIEDGEIEPAGGVFFRARIDLKHQNAYILERDLVPGDRIVALVPGPGGVDRLAVELARVDGVGGDLLAWPGRALPAGTPLVVHQDEDDTLRVAGLVSGMATLEGTGGSRRYLTFAGPHRFRELLATPERWPPLPMPIHRPDGISTVK